MTPPKLEQAMDSLPTANPERGSPDEHSDIRGCHLSAPHIAPLMPGYERLACVRDDCVGQPWPRAIRLLP
jgi:hypothetical protein